MNLEIIVTSLYAGIFGILLLPFSIRVGLRRIATDTFFLDGGDDILLRRIRSHANFLEYVPFALLLLALCEHSGASPVFIHIIGSMLLFSRLLHYYTLNTNPLGIGRAISMVGTFIVFISCSGWLIYQFSQSSM